MDKQEEPAFEFGRFAPRARTLTASDGGRMFWGVREPAVSVVYAGNMSLSGRLRLGGGRRGTDLEAHVVAYGHLP